MNAEERAAKKLAARVVKYIESCTVPSGDHAGELFTVLPWERRFVVGALTTPGPAGLSVARKNGKSGIVAALACAVIDPEGPLHGSRRHVVCVASAFQQARIVFEDVIAILDAKYPGLPRKAWRVQDSANNAQIEHKSSGARVRCIGSDAKRAHGMRPYLVLADEPAQWPRGESDRMYAALRTAMAQGGKLIALGTRSADTSHWFSKLLRGENGYAQVHACEPDAPLTVASLKRANPSYAHFPNLRALLAEELDEARTDPAALVRLKALHMNAGVEDTERLHLVDAERWAEAENESAEREGLCSWGVDLGTSHAMSAIAAYWPRTGRLECVAAFPRVPSLAERGLAAGVGSLYSEMAELGELVIAGERAVELRSLLGAALDRFGPPAAITFDAWREAELLDVLDEMRFPLCQLVKRRNGPRDGSEDVRAFTRAVVDGDVQHVGSLLLDAAMREAMLNTDAVGNTWLAKRAEGGRRARAQDDAAAAAVLAVSTGVQGPEPTLSERTRSA